MKQYLWLLQAILDNWVATWDRTGTGTFTLPWYNYQCILEKDNEGIIHNFPLLTTKRMSLKSVWQELTWKLHGDTNIRRLIEQKNHIWTERPFKKYLEETWQKNLLDNMWKDTEKSDYTDEWKTTKADFENKIMTDDEFCAKWWELGRTYWHHFRNFWEVTVSDLDEWAKNILLNNGHKPNDVIMKWFDQLMEAINLINHNPENRRIIISLWNAQDVSKTLLPPCPCFYQFFANEEWYLHLNMYQRSCDTFLGVPYNTAQDSLFLCMMAHVTGRKPGRFNHFFGDAHIYKNHVEQVKEQLTRTPHELPSIRLNPDVKNILDFTREDIELIWYEHEDSLRGAVSI